MTIPVMMFIDGPAEGFMLSTHKQVYTVGLHETTDGRWMCALYYKFGADPAYGGLDIPLTKFPEQGVYKYKENVERKASLVDGYLGDFT